MRRYGIALLLIVAVAGFVYLATPRPVVAMVSENPHALLDEPGTYIGAKACRKCHLKQHRSWSKTPHAKALDVLSDEEKAKPDCVKCHVTGAGEPSGFVSEGESKELAFVGCEACHGAGSGYKDKEVMKDRDASIAGGMVLPDEQTCLGCHNDESPNFPGSFDYEAMKAEGVHEIKS